MINWTKIAEIAFAFIASAGGVGAVAVWVIKTASDSLADRLSKKYQLQLDKEKEKYRTELSKKEYVSKARFDAEFSIYRELTASFFEAVRDVNILIPAGFTYTPADDKEREEQDARHFEAARKSVYAAQTALHANACFIPKGFFEQYQALLQQANLQLDAYIERFNLNHHPPKKTFELADYKRSAEITDMWMKLLDNIRDYLSALDVVS